MHPLESAAFHGAHPKQNFVTTAWLSAGNTRLQRSGWMRYAPSMLRPAFRWIGALFAIALLAATVFVVNLIWFRPFSLNLFYEKAFITFVLEQLLAAAVADPGEQFIGGEPERYAAIEGEHPRLLLEVAVKE